MRFTRKQVTEENQKAHNRGYKIGKRNTRFKSFFGFVFGVAIGAVGMFEYTHHTEKVNSFAIDQYHKASAYLHQVINK